MDLSSRGPLLIGLHDKPLFSMLTPEEEDILQARPHTKSIVIFGIEVSLFSVSESSNTFHKAFSLMKSLWSADCHCQNAKDGVTVTTSESIAFQLVKDAAIPEFKAFTTMIKEAPNKGEKSYQPRRPPGAQLIRVNRSPKIREALLDHWTTPIRLDSTQRSIWGGWDIRIRIPMWWVANSHLTSIFYTNFKVQKGQLSSGFDTNLYRHYQRALSPTLPALAITDLLMNLCTANSSSKIWAAFIS